MCTGVSRAKAASLVILGWVAFFALGCGGGVKPTGELHGKVKHNGNDVTAGNVMFFPEAGGEPISASIDPDGSYRATGLPIGRSRMAIETLQFKNMTPPPPGIEKQLGGLRPKYVAIPEKYERPETSGLTVDVVKGSKPFDIDLP
jgi:hypothetical protein